MRRQQFLHIRLPTYLDGQLEELVQQGLFSHKNEAIRAAIRHILLKYGRGRQ